MSSLVQCPHCDARILVDPETGKPPKACPFCHELMDLQVAKDEVIEAAPAPSFIAPGATYPRSGWKLWLAVATLTVSLLLMSVLANRDAIAAQAKWRPTMQSLCSALHCTLAPWKDLGAFRMLDHEVRTDATQPGVLRVQAGFRNEAPWPQAWPALQMTLSDADGKVLGQRAFAPHEYLADTPAATLGAGQTAAVRLRLREPAAGAVSFDFRFLPAESAFSATARSTR